MTHIKTTMQQGKSRLPAANISLNYIVHHYNHTHAKLSNIMIIPNFPKTHIRTHANTAIQTLNKLLCLSNIWFVQDELLFIHFPTDPLQYHIPQSLRRNLSRDPVPLQNNSQLSFSFKDFCSTLLFPGKRNFIPYLFQT